MTEHSTLDKVQFESLLTARTRTKPESAALPGHLWTIPPRCAYKTRLLFHQMNALNGPVTRLLNRMCPCMIPDRKSEVITPGCAAQSRRGKRW